MRILFFILFFIMFFAKGILAQERYVDSLKKYYTKHEYQWEDSTKVDFLNRVFFHYIFLQSDSAYAYAHKVFSLAKKTDYQKGLALYYNNLGILHRVEGSFEDGLESILLSLKINEKIKDNIGTANNYVNMGLIYQAQKKYDVALDYYQKCLDIKTQFKDTVGMAYCMRDMGGLYVQQKNYQKAKHIFQQVIQLKSRPPIAFGAIKDLGVIAFKEKDYPKTKEYLENCIEGMLTHDKFNVPQAYMYLAKVHYIEQNPQKALDYFDKALKYALEYKNNIQEKEIYFELFNFFKTEKNFERATFYLEAYTTLQDKIFNVETNNQIHRIQNNFALKKQENKLKFLEKKQETQQERNRWIAFVMMLVIMAVIVFAQFLWQKNKTKRHLIALLKQKNDALEEKNEEINQQKEEISSFNDALSHHVAEKTQELHTALENLTLQNSDLEKFSFMVSHIIGAPVKRFLGLLSVVEKEKISSEINKMIMKMLEENAQELNNLILGLDKILSTREAGKVTKKEEISVKYLFEKVCKNLKKDIIHAKATITIHLKAEDKVYGVEDYMESVLFNILENAINLRNFNTPLVVDVYIKDFLQETHLIVQDNGIGIDMEKQDIYKVYGLYQRMNTHTEGKGLGLYLVKTQMEAMNGKIEIISKQGCGSVFTLIFPKK